MNSREDADCRACQKGRISRAAVRCYAQAVAGLPLRIETMRARRKKIQEKSVKTRGRDVFVRARKQMIRRGRFDASAMSMSLRENGSHARADDKKVRATHQTHGKTERSCSGCFEATYRVNEECAAAKDIKRWTIAPNATERCQTPATDRQSPKGLCQTPTADARRH